MSLSCSSPHQAPTLPFPLSSPLDTEKSHHFERNTSVSTHPPTIPNTVSPTPQDSNSSPLDSTRNNSAFFSSPPTQPSHSSSRISLNSSSKSISSSHSSPISMSTDPILTTSNNLPLSLQKSRATSSHNSSTAVSSNSLPYTMSCPTGFQFSYDHMYPDSQSSLSPDTPSHTLPGASRTPNIYINGLPPNFPEQELFALARTFGEIKSVRTFTRHVSEKPTGYGFVLFNSIDSAERCIEGLRKYRNLHPSFSKQLHRIPGTVYAEQSPSLIDRDEYSFKARMEKLKDESSSNLYIEGLPLSIDEESLAALVYPYAIKSSRFFKTKLSEPPRIIAFVRLESRPAAEDTIERLHGRMVRGLNDPGCRISVRFADSAEQRELRRSERLSKNGDQSPARLTIAQAALLNLRGKEIQSHARKTQLHHVHDTPIIDQPRVEPSHSSVHHNYPNLNLASVPAGDMSMSTSLPGHLGYPYGSSARYQDPPSNCANDYLLSLQRNINLADSYSGTTPDEENEDRAIQCTHRQLFSNATAYAANMQSSVQQPRSQIQAKNGFTPTEELILQAHAVIREQQYQQLQTQQQFAHSRDCTVSQRAPSGRLETGRKLNANAQVFHVEQPIAHSSAGPGRRSKFIGDSLTPISEDDFYLGQHSSDSMLHYEYLRSRHREELHLRGDAGNAMLTKPPSRAIEIVAPPPHLDIKSSLQSHRRSQPPSHSHLSLQQQAKARDRPATLTRCPNSSQHDYQHIGSGSNCLGDVGTATSSTKDKPEASSKSHLHAREASQPRSDGSSNHQSSDNSASKAYIPMHKSPSVAQQLSSKDGIKSPALISPALTYSSHTPSTLSPATPFLGSFNGSFSASSEAFEFAMAHDKMIEKVKMESHTH